MKLLFEMVTAGTKLDRQCDGFPATTLPPNPRPFHLPYHPRITLAGTRVMNRVTWRGRRRDGREKRYRGWVMSPQVRALAEALATLEGAPDECRRNPCRETGLCHLDYRRKWELFCPGSNSPHLERFGAGLLVVVADFIAEFMRGPGPDDAALW